MKANNLTISIPTTEKRCNKNCEYCISTITWQTKPNPGLMLKNIKKVKRLINVAGVSNVLITSKGEPFLNLEMLQIMMMEFKDYWLEVQTNGVLLKNAIHDYTTTIVSGRVNIVALSIDQPWHIDYFGFVYARLEEFDVISRVCINVTKNFKDYSFKDIMDMVKSNNIRQVLFRNISYPSTAPKDNPAVKWIDENVDDMYYLKLVNEAVGLPIIRIIEELGVVIYDYDGVSVCFSDYCIQEKNKHDDIRSLIFHEDGHVYTSWDSPASILF